MMMSVLIDYKNKLSSITHRVGRDTKAIWLECPLVFQSSISSPFPDNEVHIHSTILGWLLYPPLTSHAIDGRRNAFGIVDDVALVFPNPANNDYSLHSTIFGSTPLWFPTVRHGHRPCGSYTQPFWWLFQIMSKGITRFRLSRSSGSA